MHPARPTSSRVRAFTLVELLAVIAIVGILSAILIPTIGRARASAHNSTCQGNLRQIGLAVNLFLNERGIYPPARAVNGGSSNVAVTDNNGVNVLWPQLLRPYLGSTVPVSRDSRLGTGNEIGVCPARTITPPVDDEHARVTYSAHPRIMVDDGTATPIRRNNIPRPAQVILMADGTQQAHGGAQSNFYSVESINVTSTNSADGGSPVSTAADTDPTSSATFRYRHPGDSMNVVFADGHVGKFAKGEILRRNISIYY